jgi:recombination protein RecT
MSNELVVFDEFKKELESSRDRIFKLAQSHVNQDQYTVQIALAVAQSFNKKTGSYGLLTCDRQSLWFAVGRALSFDLQIGLNCYIVPFKGKATLVAGWRGLATLAFRSGLLASLETRCVYKDDDFEYMYGTSDYLSHTPAKAHSDVWSEVYAIAKMHGGHYFKVMSHTQIMAHKNKYKKKYESTCWRDHPIPMAQKTVLIQVLKLVPWKCKETQQIVQDTEFVDNTKDEDIIEGEMVIPPQDLDQLAEVIDQPQGK